MTLCFRCFATIKPRGPRHNVANTIQFVTYLHFVYISDIEACINPSLNALSPSYRFLAPSSTQILVSLQIYTVLNLGPSSSHDETPSCYLPHVCHPSHHGLNTPPLHPPNSPSASTPPKSFTRSRTHPHRPRIWRPHNRNAVNTPKP